MGFFATIAVVFVVAFLLGSIPFGLIVSKGIFKRDLRQVGSGNIGTTNAIRALGKVGGYLVFVLDYCKGLLAAGIAYYLVTSASFVHAGADPQLFAPLCLSVSVLGACLGHIFSPWLKFKGGKGVAASAGALTVAYGVVPVLILVALFAIIVATSKYVSLGSVCCAAAAFATSFMVFPHCLSAWVVLFFVAGTIVWAHRENISRLLAGTENKIGKRV